MGKGAKPARYHRAVPVQISTVRSPCPYHGKVRRCHMPTFLWRLPKLALTSGVVATTHKKGKAQHCLVQGKVTTTAITIQRNPGLLTDRLRLESALSR